MIEDQTGQGKQYGICSEGEVCFMVLPQPIEETFVCCGRDHSQFLNEDESQKGVPLMSRILGTLYTPNSLEDKFGVWVLGLGERMMREAKAEPLHVEGGEVEVVPLSWVVDHIELEGIGHVNKIKANLFERVNCNHQEEDVTINHRA